MEEKESELLGYLSIVSDPRLDRKKLHYQLWGLRPAWVTGDSWYSSIGNMKLIRKLGLTFMFGIENNRTISIDRGQYIQIQKLEELG